MLRRYFELVLDHRYATLLICLLITGLALFSASRTVIASSIGKLFLDDLPAYHDYQERMKAFGNDEVFFVAYEDPAPLSRESTERLRSAVDAIRNRPEVSRVASLLDAVWVGSEQGTLLIEPYADLVESRSQDQAMALLLADPLYRGSLVSQDGSAAAIMVELTVDPHRPIERAPQLVGEVYRDFADAGFDPTTLRRAGMPAIFAEIMEQTYFNLSRLFPLSALALLVVVFLLFRRLAPAVVTLAIGGISVAWTLGFAALLDREFSVFTALVPVVVLTVAFSDIVHLWSAFLTELREGLAKREAILASASDVGLACLLTSVTTLTGFIAISLVPTPASRQLGFVLGFGVAVALLLAMTLVPVALSFLPEPKPTRGRETRDLLNPVVDACARLSTRHPWSVLAGFALLAIPLGLGMARYDVETDFAERFAADNDLRVDQRWFDEHFIGSHTIELFVEAPEVEGLQRGEAFARLAALHDAIEAQPDVDEVYSPVDPVRALHRAMQDAAGGDIAEQGSSRLPEAEHAIAQYLLLFEMSGGGAGGGQALDSWIDFERRTARLAVRTPVGEYRATGRLGNHCVDLGEGILGDGAKIEATGFVYLLGSYFDEIIDGQRKGLLLSFAVIALMMVIGLRSIRTGVLSMIPNLLPLAALCAYCGYRWGPTDSDMIMAAVMAIGIGVDDTIHFLMRYRVEAGRSPPSADPSLALERTFRFAGRAIVMTTVILCIGFLPFALSDYFTVNMLGTMLPGVLLAAVVADLLLVPAMIRVGIIGFGSGPKI